MINSYKVKVPAAVPTAAAPAPGGATTHAPHRSRPYRAASAEGRGATRLGCGRVRARRGGRGNSGGGEEVAGGGCWLRARGGREFARSEACLVSRGGAAPLGLRSPGRAHAQCPRGARRCSALWQRGGKACICWVLPGPFRAGLGTTGTSRPRPAHQRNHQWLPCSLRGSLKADNNRMVHLGMNFSEVKTYSKNDFWEFSEGPLHCYSEIMHQEEQSYGEKKKYLQPSALEI
ncbi:uncharacterized protein LOC112476986 [Pteropus alecto]|uniref:uncharacterized protein LOC112476986 n=1 Tax=Pteropus alecto TaxID=9402 RepID=UPI000D535FAF|nr:uncharacterized protein LOC112476986 [Pteropus alecto]